jgi:quinol monooxygenase YgiN
MPKSNEVTVVARLRAAPGKAEALAAMLTEQVGVVRKAEPGCLAYRLHRSTQDPDLFVFYETYADAAAFAAHRDAPYVLAYRERRQREGLAAGPVEIEILQALTD